MSMTPSEIAFPTFVHLLGSVSSFLEKAAAHAAILLGPGSSPTCSGRLAVGADDAARLLVHRRRSASARGAQAREHAHAYWDWTFRDGEAHYHKYCGAPPEHLLFGVQFNGAALIGWQPRCGLRSRLVQPRSGRPILHA